MMASKAKLFGDETSFQKIVVESEMKVIKELGREVRNFDGAVWDREKFGIVVAGNQAKFSQKEELSNYLLGTATKVLVEASTYDKIWGIGLAEDDPAAKSVTSWKGLNLLGFALMVVRSRLKG
jgi:ribA/ribD-fused uncharacterized protein